MMSVILLILTAALSGCAGGRGATTSSPPRPAPSRTAVQPTTPAEASPPGCDDAELPALVLVPPPGRDADPRRFILAGPEGEEHCSLEAPYVPWASTECQMMGERLMCWDETRNALQVLDVRSGELAYVDPELEEETRLDFLVSPDGDQIVWSTTDLDVSQAADVPEGTSRCSVIITHGDGSNPETLLEKRYDNLYHLEPVTWTREDDAIFFARIRVWLESGGAFIPTFPGRYSALFRLDLASGELQKVFPLDDAAVCDRCIGDVSSDGRWLAHHREDGALVLRDFASGEETLIADGSSACYLGHARLSPGGRHLVHIEMEGPCDERDTFDVARAVMVDVPFEGQSRVLTESTEAVDWPVGWLGGETPIFDRIYKGFDQRGLWVARHPVAGTPSTPEDLVPGILIGVVRPSLTGTSEGESDR